MLQRRWAAKPEAKRAAHSRVRAVASEHVGRLDADVVVTPTEVGARAGAGGGARRSRRRTRSSAELRPHAAAGELLEVDALVPEEQAGVARGRAALGLRKQDRLQLWLREVRHLRRRRLQQGFPRNISHVVLRSDLRAEQGGAVAEVAPLVERRRLLAHSRLVCKRSSWCAK